ncbi:MAG: hypothetical protein KC419_23505, partial [Anaerolineales bacterium]|nr:hypothetical protein [Anaerolineales bacterium]
AWPTKKWVMDQHAVPLPPVDEGHQQPFVLVAQLYEVANPSHVALTRRLGELTRDGEHIAFQQTVPVFELPTDMMPETAVFGDQIALRGYNFTQTGTTLDLELVWQAVENGRVDTMRFVHLIDPDIVGKPIAQVDSMPRNGSYPTSQWAAGEIVVESVTLSLADVPPGDYQLAVGFYDVVDEVAVRLTAVDQSGVNLTDNRLILPLSILVP